MRVGGCGLSSPDVTFLQEIDKLKETNVESRQVNILQLDLRKEVALSKSVRDRSMSQ